MTDDGGRDPQSVPRPREEEGNNGEKGTFRRGGILHTRVPFNMYEMPVKQVDQFQRSAPEAPNSIYNSSNLLRSLSRSKGSRQSGPTKEREERGGREREEREERGEREKEKSAFSIFLIAG